MKTLSQAGIFPSTVAYGRRHAQRSPQLSSAQTPVLQRTYGNAALGRADETLPADPQLLAQSMQSIVQRSSAARTAGHPQVQSHTGGPVVQRLISADDWSSSTSFWFASGKSDTFFQDVTKRLRTYEGPLKSRTHVEKLEHLREIYRVLDEWAISPAANESSRKGNVSTLLNDLAKEMKILQTPGGTGKANTAPALGVMGTKAVPVRGGKPTPAQEQAIATIDGTGLEPVRKAHARDMIRNPDVVQQAAFGVCGLTSILYVVAKSNPQRFAEMIRDAWSDTALVKEWMPIFYKNATPEQIQERAEVEYVTSQWLVRKSAPTNVTQNVLVPGDDTASGSKDKQFKDVLDKQRSFSDSFEIAGWENTFGHFAMTTGGLNYLLNSLGSGKKSYKVKVSEFDKDYAAARAKAGSGSLIASVVDTNFYRQNDAPVAQDFVKTRKPRYVHWVILKDAVQAGDFFKLKIWTWGADFNATVHKDVIKSYIYSFIAAEAET